MPLLDFLLQIHMLNDDQKLDIWQQVRAGYSNPLGAGCNSTVALGPGTRITAGQIWK